MERLIAALSDVYYISEYYLYPEEYNSNEILSLVLALEKNLSLLPGDIKLIYDKLPKPGISFNIKKRINARGLNDVNIQFTGYMGEDDKLDYHMNFRHSYSGRVLMADHPVRRIIEDNLHSVDDRRDFVSWFLNKYCGC